MKTDDGDDVSLWEIFWLYFARFMILVFVLFAGFMFVLVIAGCGPPPISKDMLNPGQHEQPVIIINPNSPDTEQPTPNDEQPVSLDPNAFPPGIVKGQEPQQPAPRVQNDQFIRPYDRLPPNETPINQPLRMQYGNQNDENDMNWSGYGRSRRRRW